MTTMLDFLCNQVPDRVVTTIVSTRSFMPPAERGDGRFGFPCKPLGRHERERLLEDLRVLRDGLRRSEYAGAVAWLDMSIVQISLECWRAEAVPAGCRDAVPAYASA